MAEVSNKKILEGVGGWLAWLVFAMCLLGPSMMLSGNESMLRQIEQNSPDIASLAGWVDYKRMMSANALASSAILFVGGMVLALRKKRTSVFIAIGALWIANLGAVTAGYAAAHHSFPQLMGDQANSILVGGLMKAVLIAGVWSLYLLRSRRVRNTYHPHDVKQQSTTSVPP